MLSSRPITHADMASSSKHLKQLLSEDQEPFVLQNYIDERRLHLRHKPKRTPISSLTKSPLFYFSNNSSSQPQSPFRPKSTTNADTLFIHVPSRTAALLLDAALRIQRQSGPKKARSQKGRLGFAIWGSILSILGRRKKARKREIREKQREPIVAERKSMAGLSCSRRIEERFPDFGTSTSCGDEETELFAFEEAGNEGVGSSSPVRFALMINSPEVVGRSSGFESPASSSEFRRKQEVLNDEEVLQQGHVLAREYSEEEKEHSSPVSVLDNPQFEEDDDDDDDEGGEVQESDENEDNDVGLELEQGFAIVQRTKRKLLQKLRRFEQLAELDPVELEKRILEDEDEDDEEEEEYSTDSDDSSCSSLEDNSAVFARGVLTCASPFDCQRVYLDVKKLVLDIGEREERALGFEGKDKLTKKLSGRFGSWKETKTKALDMLVELDLRSEGQEWRKNHEEDLQGISASIELGIFGFLVEELSEELVHDSSTCS